MKTIVIYYSFTGNTKKAAVAIAARLNCDIEEIKYVHPYSGSDEEIDEITKLQVQKKETPEILPLKSDLSDYDRIILGTPVWWFDIVPAVRSFLSKYSLVDKKVYAFICNGGNAGEVVNTFKTMIPQIDREELLYLNFNDKILDYQDIINKWIKKSVCKRPVTTLFMLTSVDGKISTGSTDELDVDKDFPKFEGLNKGLHQYYEIEATTDLWSLNSGRVQQKMGVNEKEFSDHHWGVSFVLLDNHHLTRHGVEYFCALSNKFVLVTSNPDHPAYSVDKPNLSVLYYEKLNLTTMLEDLYCKFGCTRITIQTGSTLNAAFLREKLFDFVDIVVAPVLIGGTDTSSLIGGPSFQAAEELEGLGVLKLLNADILEDSYIRLRYEVPDSGKETDNADYK